MLNNFATTTQHFARHFLEIIDGVIVKFLVLKNA